MNQTLFRSIVETLKHHRQPVTVGALAGVIAGEGFSETEDEPEQIHPDLCDSISANPVIQTPEALSEWLALHAQEWPGDDWERMVLSIGTDCGVSPPPSAFTSDGLYD